MNITGSFAGFFRIDFLHNSRFHRTITRVSAALRGNILFDRHVISIIVGGVVLAIVVRNFHRSAPTHPNMPQPAVIPSIPAPEKIVKAAKTISYEYIQRCSTSIFTSVTTSMA